MSSLHSNENSTRFAINSLYALAFALFLLVSLFQSYSFTIPEGSATLVGQATRENILVDARIGLFYKLIGLGLLFWTLGLGILHWLSRRFIHLLDKYAVGLYIAIPVIPLSFLHLLGTDVLAPLKLLIGILIIFLSSHYLFTFSKPHLLQSNEHVSFESTLGISFLLSLLLQFYAGYSSWMGHHSELLFLLLLALLQITLFAFRFNISKNNTALYALWLSSIPFFVFISFEYEVFCLSNETFNLGHKKSFLILLLLWIAMWWSLKKYSKLKIDGISKHLFRLSLLFGLTISLFYKPFFEVQPELFEMANPANSILRIFDFGELPFLHFMSSHLLSEQWYGILYSLFFGTSQGLDFTVYAFLNEFIYFVMISYILTKVGFKQSTSILFIFLFPVVNDLFFASLCLVFLILFVVQRTSIQFTTKNIFFILLVPFLLTLWRLDTGVAGVISTCIFVPYYFWIAQIKIKFTSLLKGVGLFIALLISLCAFSLLFISPEVLIGNLNMVFHYIKGNQAHGYAHLTENAPHQFFVIHFLFVLVSLTLLVWGTYLIHSNRNKQNIAEFTWLVFSMFSFIVFIANAQRGLVRHGFAEHSEIFYYSTFYLGVAFFIGHFMRKKLEAIQYAAFFLILFFSFITTKFFPFELEESAITKIVDPEVFENADSLLKKDNFQGRIVNFNEFKDSNYGQIKKYLDDQLSANETFLDFSNSPLLYYYCKRTIPSYFNQPLQNSIDTFLQNQLILKISQSECPIVIYSSYPTTWFDATDGLQNSVRYPIIAEYIYDHYKPLGILNQKSIWGIKTREWQSIPELDTLVTKPQSIDLGYLAGYDGNRISTSSQKIYTSQNISPSSSSIPILITSNSIGQEHVSLFFKFNELQFFNPEIVSEKIEIRKLNGEVVYQAAFTRDDKHFNWYNIPLSNNYFWYTQDTLTLTFENNTSLSEAYLLNEE
jgi:hypothetical protein